MEISKITKTVLDTEETRVIYRLLGCMSRDKYKERGICGDDLELLIDMYGAMEGKLEND